jgi:hypothetical protein
MKRDCDNGVVIAASNTNEAAADLDFFVVGCA